MNPSRSVYPRSHRAANPLWRDYRVESQALAVFQGPQVYISPSLPSKAEPERLCQPELRRGARQRHAGFIQDAGWLRNFVAGLTATHEATRPVPWKIDDAPAPYIDKMVSLIVGFEFSITALSGKWKVSQNRSQADREGVLRSLQGADDADSHEMAAMLAAALARKSESPTGR